MTAIFFERLLRKFERDVSICVTKLTKCAALEKGGNFVSKVERVHIEGVKRQQEYKNTLITKILQDNGMSRRFHFDVMFRNEVKAYKEILPALRTHSKSELLLPECLYADDNLIVLQDLANFGWRNTAKGERYSPEKSEIVLKELAKLHAASLSLQQREPERTSRLRKLVTDIYDPQNGDALRQGLQRQILAAIKVFDQLEKNQRNQRIIHQLSQLVETVYKDVCDTLLSEKEISVFNHGDTWGNNLMFKNGQVRLIDFQMMRCTSVAADLTYFLYVNMKPAERKANVDALLVKYLESLKLHSQVNGVCKELIEKLSIEWLKSEIRDFALFGFVSAIYILPVFHLKPEVLDADSDTNEGDFCKEITEDHKGALVEYVLDFLEVS